MEIALTAAPARLETASRPVTATATMGGADAAFAITMEATLADQPGEPVQPGAVAAVTPAPSSLAGIAAISQAPDTASPATQLLATDAPAPPVTGAAPLAKAPERDPCRLPPKGEPLPAPAPAPPAPTGSSKSVQRPADVSRVLDSGPKPSPQADLPVTQPAAPAADASALLRTIALPTPDAAADQPTADEDLEPPAHDDNAPPAPPAQAMASVPPPVPPMATPPAMVTAPARGERDESMPLRSPAATTARVSPHRGSTDGTRPAPAANAGHAAAFELPASPADQSASGPPAATSAAGPMPAQTGDVAAAARQHGSSAAQPVVTAQPGRIGHELGVEIARRVSAGGDQLVVRLAPAELGRIEVRMSFTESGGLTTVFAADNPAAIDMLRRDSAELSRSLSDAGFRSDAGSLRFDGGDRSNGGNGQPRTPWQRAAAHGAGAEAAESETFDQGAFRSMRTRGRYNLMA